MRHFQAVLLVAGLFLAQLAHALQLQQQQQQQLEELDVACSQRHLAAVEGSRGFGGLSRPTVSSKPAFASRPPGGTFAPAAAMRPPPGRVTGTSALPGGFSGFGRSGYRSTPFALPFTAGLLAAGALSTLNRDRNAFCNGVSVQCYKAACQDALNTRCPEAAAGNATLVLSACPDRRFSECYRTLEYNNTSAASFECFGVRRPRYRREDLAAVCHQPSNMLTNSAGTASRRGVQVFSFWLPLAAAAAILLCW